MSDINSGYLFVPSEGRDRLSSTKLNAQLNGATINPSFVASKPAVSSVTSADQLLVLKADGTYGRVPATAVGSGGSGGGGGDMFKATYDTNNNGKVDTCDSLPWGSVTGKPATFPPDSTAMLKSVYDANADNIVDHAALADTATNANAVPWTGVSGKPSTFPPDSTAMLKSVYDTNGDGISDHAALADSAPWGGITGLPASFPASAHAPTHLDNGSDPISVATTSRTGVLRILSGSASQYLDGSGNWSTPTGTGATVDPGVWTSLTPASGWSAGPVTPQYRIESINTVKTVYCRGTIQAAYSALGTTAFTFPSAAFPSGARGRQLSGYQNTGTASDVAAYIATVSTAGVVVIYFLGAGAFVYADKSQTQVVYLDGLLFSL